MTDDKDGQRQQRGRGGRLADGGGGGVRFDVVLVYQHFVDHVDDAVRATDVGAVHVYPFVPPFERVTWETISGRFISGRVFVSIEFERHSRQRIQMNLDNELKIIYVRIPSTASLTLMYMDTSRTVGRLTDKF